MDNLQNCMEKLPVGMELPSNNFMVKMGVFSSLIGVYWFLYMWSYGKGYEAIDETIYGNIISLEKTIGIILGVVLMFGWLILPLVNKNFIASNNVLVYGIFGLMLGTTTIVTTINIIEEDKKLYGESGNSDSSFKAWSQIRLIIFCMFNILGIAIVNKRMSRE